MEGLIIKQEELKDQITKAFNNYRKSPKDRITKSYIESRLERLEIMWSNFTAGHMEVIITARKEEKSKLTYFTSNVHESVEETYLEYKTRLKEDLEVTKQNATTCLADKGQGVTTSNCEVKLPQIHLPTFSGAYEEWQSFYDMFVSVIHNNHSISAVQKLHYLKGTLRGEPELLLKNLSTTDMNYEEAWNTLIRRYNNKRYNSNEILKRLFSQKTVTVASAYSIKQLLDTTSACLKSLTNLGVNTESWDIIISYLVMSKLDYETRKQWEIEVCHNKSDDLPTWEQLINFLESRFRTLEMLDGNKTIAKSYTTTTTKQMPRSKYTALHASIQEDKKDKIKVCALCSNQHLLHQCKEFISKSPQERSEYIQIKGLCFNCLSSNHTVRGCHQATCCRRCGRRHHTLLHFERTLVPEPISTAEPVLAQATHGTRASPESEKRVVAHFTKEEHQGEVLLATALAKAKSVDGYNQVIRVLIDQGSEASFVTENIAQSLGLKRVPVTGLVSGVGDAQLRSKSMVTFYLESLNNSEYSVQVNAFVLSSLTSFLPSTKTSIVDWPEINELPLADPHYGLPKKIDVILGVDIYSDIILGDLLKHPSNNGPIAQKTQLGWVLSGRVIHHQYVTPRVMHIKMREDDLLRQFWEIEREPEVIGKRLLTREEKKCEELYEKTTERSSEGRYVVRLPFREEEPKCIHGKSREIALRRFSSLEKKLQRNEKLKEDYKKVMEDYVSQNHMTLIQEENITNPRAVYLPHHAVIREDKDTTKVRVVFDASCKGVNNVSLNDTLLVGPKLQQDLRHILMRWRRHPYCRVADLVQMYRQVLVHESDVDYQRILWRPHPDQPIRHYKLLRLTFGTSCAPYLAVKSLQQLARDEQDKYPLASTITLQDYYMDDLLTGCESEEETIEIFNQLSMLMNAGGFQLQKWYSNSQQLLNHIENERKRSDQSVVFKVNNMIKVLGIAWNKNTDNFEYTHNLGEVEDLVTKRQVLSDVARLYDPLGWIAPVIVTAKAFIQKLWKSGLNWDDQLTSQLLTEWIKFRRDLGNVKSISIPRWLNTRNSDHLELHAFGDASQMAYAGVVYIKSRNEKGEINMKLVTAKTKVAPIDKEVSIPRLELCAALLATKLLLEVSQIMGIHKQQLFAWSDSKVVLAWIRGEPSRWTTFVSNRVSEILSIIDREQWNYVATAQNPADCASRGMSISQLINHRLWWEGPYFLRELHQYTNTLEFVTREEERPIKALTTVVQNPQEPIWRRFSNLQKMLRVLSYCRRFLYIKAPKDQRVTSNNVSVKESQEVLECCIRVTQSLYFEEDLKHLRLNGQVTKRSLLYTLSPFLDENRVLRVGGRINEAQVHYNKKHPIIMPSECHLTKLIILDAHLKTLHGGPQIMLNLIRSKYWIIRARERVKKCYRECVTCLRYSRQNNNQFMGQLPKARIAPDKPFRSSGVDFTGCINLRFSPGRGAKSYKGYICVYVCMATRAIHLEAVSDLTTSGFIAAFRRFVSRRGHCQHLYSDNGTNFVGAEKELREMLKRSLLQFPDEITNQLANEGTTWHFIPPHAPNFGGLWEAGVRSVKTHLKRVVGDVTLTFEELSTVLAQIEACLNSRPISLLSDNPEDPLPLTPGHFLVGEPLITLPDEDYTSCVISGLQRWKLSQKIVNDFWRKWSDEYLVTLNQRYKWATKKSEPGIGDIVIVRDHNRPPCKWLLGKVVEKHPGKDDVTRVVTLKTKNGLCKRP